MFCYVCGWEGLYWLGWWEGPVLGGLVGGSVLDGFVSMYLHGGENIYIRVGKNLYPQYVPSKLYQFLVLVQENLLNLAPTVLESCQIIKCSMSNSTTTELSSYR